MWSGDVKTRPLLTGDTTTTGLPGNLHGALNGAQGGTGVSCATPNGLIQRV
jgi:hypothetical protein